MKIFLRLLGLCLVAIVAAAVVWIFVPTWRFAPICAPAEAWLIDHGAIKIEDADWGYLKLRSGAYGRKALRDLRRRAQSERVAATAATVERFYYAKGERIGLRGDTEPTPAESRIGDLLRRLPDDGRLTPFHLKPGQAIPTDLMDDIRFQVGCPQNACFMQLDDLNGDGTPEAILVSHTGIRVFSRQPTGWAQSTSARGCLEDENALAQGHFEFVPARFDDLMVNGHRLAFELSECGPWHLPTPIMAPGMAPNPYSDVKLLRPYAKRFAQSAVISPKGGIVPATLLSDMANGTIVTDTVTGNQSSFVMPPYESIPAQTISLYPDKAGVPRCALGEDGKTCMIVLADLDRDGRDEVIVIDRAITEDNTDFHEVTLMRFEGEHWHVVARGDLCGEWGNPSALSYTTTRPLWKNMSIDAKRIDLDGEACRFRRMVVY